MNFKATYKTTKYACYYAYLSCAAVFILPPILFATFREMYGISYTLLGTLVLINFCTQLCIDLVFTFFADKFNIHKTIKTMPIFTSAGLFLYALGPNLFPQYAFLCLAVSTFIFSVAAGLGEVLISPLVAALPSDNHERDMSALHSLYAYGLLMVISISTVFFAIFGTHNWMYLTVFFAILPLFSAFLFSVCPLPEMDMGGGTKKEKSSGRTKMLALFTLCIFLGSAAENVMSNWISLYIEKALGIPKAVGDLLGIALFAILLGFARTAYAKWGKNISKILLIGMIGAVVCYITVAFSQNNILSLTACALVGLFTSMLWPGTLIMMEEKIYLPGVAAYALMAAGGDSGAGFAPQLMGYVVDFVSASDLGINLAASLNLTPDQIGMRTGMLVIALFPFAGAFVVGYIMKKFPAHMQK